MRPISVKVQGQLDNGWPGTAWGVAFACSKSRLLNVLLQLATQTATQSRGWLMLGAGYHLLDNGSYLVSK